jgi:threonyl-tRNA synthetase
VWLAPEQAVVADIEKFTTYAQKVVDGLSAGVRVRLNAENESLGKRIRASEMSKIPYILIVGEREEADAQVAVRRYERVTRSDESR